MSIKKFSRKQTDRLSSIFEGIGQLFFGTIFLEPLISKSFSLFPNAVFGSALAIICWWSALKLYGRIKL